MRALEMSFKGKGAASVNWNGEVSGFSGVAQKAINGVMTQEGSDDLVPGRGTMALKELAGHGAFDLMAIQHTLNFAAQKTLNDMVKFDTAASPDAQIKTLRMRLAGITKNVAQAMVIVGNRAGETSNDNLTIE